MTAGTPSKPDQKDYADQHPEQDPAEGSREVIDRDLKESGKALNKSAGEAKNGDAPGHRTR